MLRHGGRPPGSVKPRQRIGANPERRQRLRDRLHLLALGEMGNRVCLLIQLTARAADQGPPNAISGSRVAGQFEFSVRWMPVLPHLGQAKGMSRRMALLPPQEVHTPRVLRVTWAARTIAMSNRSDNQ